MPGEQPMFGWEVVYTKFFGVPKITLAGCKNEAGIHVIVIEYTRLVLKLSTSPV